MRPTKRFRPSIAISVIPAAFFATSGFAQVAPSRTVPQTLEPQEERSEETPPSVEIYSQAPSGAENFEVHVSRIDVEGISPEMQAKASAIISPLEGQRVSIAELYAAATEIEMIYKDAGLPLVRVVVPQQKIVNQGIFKMKIVDGFIGSIDSSALPRAVRRQVEKRVNNLVGKRGVTQQELERHLLLASRVAGVSLKSTLTRGEEIGSARVIISSVYSSIDASLTVDNKLSSTYNNPNITAQLSLNSMLGLGEKIFGTVATTGKLDILESSATRRLFGAGLSYPIGSDGLELIGEYIHADTKPDLPDGALAVEGRFDRGTFTLEYPLLLTRSRSLNLSGSIEIVEEKQSTPEFGIDLSRDRLRYVTACFDYQSALGGASRIGINLSASQGVNAFGARDAEDALSSGVYLSRLGSQPDFTRTQGGISVQSRIRSFSLALNLRGQKSLSGALPAAMQFSLDGPDAVSGFPVGVLNVDEGATGRAELATSFPAAKELTLMPYVFAAYGLGDIIHPTALEEGYLKAWSAGIGARVQLKSHMYVQGELSRSGSNLGEDKTRGFVTLQLRL